MEVLRAIRGTDYQSIPCALASISFQWPPPCLTEYFRAFPAKEACPTTPKKKIVDARGPTGQKSIIIEVRPRPCRPSFYQETVGQNIEETSSTCRDMAEAPGLLPKVDC